VTFATGVYAQMFTDLIDPMTSVASRPRGAFARLSRKDHAKVIGAAAGVGRNSPV
jgi:hypothetical protein